MSRRPRNLLPAPMDVLVTVALTGFITVITHAFNMNYPQEGPLDTLGYVWLVSGGLPLLYRRRFPMTVALLTVLLVISYYASGYVGGPSILSPTLALATVAYLQGPVRAGIPGVLLLLLSAGGWLFANRPLGTVGVVLMFAVAGISVGSALRARRAQLAAARNETAEAERRRTEQERLGIAREVHDVVAHSLAMINVQASTGAHVADKKPEAAKDALLAIKAASHSALNDLRATLAVLRGGAPDEQHAPTPGLDRLDELTANATAAGITVRVHGEPGELPTHVSTVAYRILQESLTNTVRHASSATTVDVWFERNNGTFGLTVTDDGTGSTPGSGGSGSGLRGMRERVDVLGGTVTAGPAEQGFRVQAKLPVGSE